MRVCDREIELSIAPQNEICSRSSVAAAAGFALPTQLGELVFAIHRLDSSAFNFVIAAIKDLLRLDQLGEVSGHGVSYQFRPWGVRSPSPVSPTALEGRG
jgi:hypothetical protein